MPGIQFAEYDLSADSGVGFELVLSASSSSVDSSLDAAEQGFAVTPNTTSASRILNKCDDEEKRLEIDGSIDDREHNSNSKSEDSQCEILAGDGSNGLEKKNSVLSLADRIHQCINIIVTWTAVASIALQCMALATSERSSTALLLSSILGLFLAALVLRGQYLFSKYERLRRIHNKIRMEINRFMHENNVLSRNVTKLHGQVKRLQGIEAQFNQVVESQGRNLHDVLELTRENAQILKEERVSECCME